MTTFCNNYLYIPKGVLNAFAKNLGVVLVGGVGNNMVYMLSHLAIISLNSYLLLNIVETVPHQFPQNRLNNCIAIIILSSAEFIIGTYILGYVHKPTLQ